VKVNRVELLGLLKILAPALASPRNSVAELSHLWFDGESVSAFNDVLGIRVAFPTEFTGGFLGEKLIGVLERSRRAEVSVDVEGENATLKIGPARITLTCRPIEDWSGIWEPQVPKEVGYEITDQFREAVDLALVSVGSANVLNPEQRGVTVVQNGKAADLYSTDAVSLSWARIDTGNRPVAPAGSRLILPTPFCEQVTALKGPAELKFDENAAYCLADVVTTGKKAGEDTKAYEMLIFSRLVEDENPVSFEDVVKQHVWEGQGVAVPAQLKLRAERAMVLLSEEPLEVEVEDGQLYLYAQTPYGEVDDVLKFPDHPDAKAKVDAALLHRALDGRERMAISKDSVVLTGPKSFTHIISTK
jgi:hypothetical protein